MKWSKNTGGLTQVKAICFLHTYRYIMAARKSTLQNIVSGFGVRSEHRIDILNAKLIGKEHLMFFAYKETRNIDILWQQGNPPYSILFLTLVYVLSIALTY